MRVLRLTLALACLIALGAPSARAACTPWSERTIVSGQGLLENLAFDHRSAMLLSASAQDAILRVNRRLGVRPLIDDVRAPGGLRVRGGVLYFNTGDDLASGLDDLTDGTIDRFRFRSERRTTWARGLTMPNGLIFLPNGDAVVSRDIGTGTGMTRVPADDPAHPEFNWARLDDTNGMAVDPTGRWLYTVGTFVSEGPVYRIKIKDPSWIQVVAELAGGGPLKGLDDMTIDRRGRLYIAANLTGEVIRVNPDSGASCVIASGLQNPSAVKFGRGRGWANRSLYVTGFDGTVRKLTPP
jgi:hypothetical protein